jgi:hypothetical protein
MVNVLSKLRIDEISVCDRGAGEGCKVVLYKRDRRPRAFGYGLSAPEAPSFYQALFAEPAHERVEHHSKRGETVDELRARTVRWLEQKGQALLDRLDMSVEEAADLVMQCALYGTSEKCHHEASDMDTNIIKTLRSMTEAEYTACVVKAAKAQYPQLSEARAFSKLFEDSGPEGIAIRRAWRIVKGDDVADDDADAAAADDADREDGGPSSLELLQRLADRLRAEHPEWTREKCFTAVYTDPSNIALAKRERLQSMNKLMRA